MTKLSEADVKELHRLYEARNRCDIALDLIPEDGRGMITLGGIIMPEIARACILAVGMNGDGFGIKLALCLRDIILAERAAITARIEKDD